MSFEMSHATPEEVSRECGPGEWWWACEYPERPGDAWTLYSWECDACVVAMVAAAAMERHLVLNVRGEVEDGIEPGTYPVQTAVERVLAYRQERGFREL